MKVGGTLGVSVKKKADADKFSDYSLSSGGDSKPSKSAPAEKKTESKQEETHKQEASQKQKSHQTGDKVFASPAAKTLASEKGVDLK